MNYEVYVQKLLVEVIQESTSHNVSVFQTTDKVIEVRPEYGTSSLDASSSGDGIEIVGSSIRINIDQLPLAPGA